MCTGRLRGSASGRGFCAHAFTARCVRLPRKKDNNTNTRGSFQCLRLVGVSLKILQINMCVITAWWIHTHYCQANHAFMWCGQSNGAIVTSSASVYSCAISFYLLYYQYNLSGDNKLPSLSVTAHRCHKTSHQTVTNKNFRSTSVFYLPLALRQMLFWYWGI